jgi:hypothetical protein
MNRSGRRIGLAVVVAAAFGLMSAPAGAAVLYDQTAGPAIGAAYSSNYGDPGKVAQGADDFTVPAGESWVISSVDAPGNGVLGPTFGGVFLYADGGTLPGTEIFRQEGIPIGSPVNDLAIPITGAPTLGPGSYWISVQTMGLSEWRWDIDDVQIGDPAAWRNPPGGYGSPGPGGCVAYQPLHACLPVGAPGSFLFRLNALDPSVAPPKKCKKGRKPVKRKGKRKCVKKKRKKKK